MPASTRLDIRGILQVQVLFRDYFRANGRVVVDVDMTRFGQVSEDFDGKTPQGLYSKLGEHDAGLFVCDKRMFLLLNDRVLDVKNEVKTLFHHRDGNRCTLTVYIGLLEEYTIEYLESRRPASTIVYSEDDEDADFGLWIHNVLKSEERIQLVLKAWQGANQISRIVLQYHDNEKVSFLQIVNFLVGYKIMTLEEAASLFRQFRSREDVAFDIPEELVSQFKKELDSLNCKYE